jgi:predicted deacylase
MGHTLIAGVWPSRNLLRADRRYGQSPISLKQGTSMAIQLGTVVSQPGTLTKGSIHAGSHADGSPIDVPLLVAEGAHDGPTVWIGACLHGEEYGGAASIIEFLSNLNLSELRGTVIGVPVSNPPSFNFRSRVSEIDGANLNRIFPGDATGSYSYQLAKILGTEFARTSNYALDLHSGGIGAEVPFYAIYEDDGSEVAAKSKELAKKLGCDVLWRAKAHEGLGGTFTAEATRAGIPSVTVEVGGGTFTPEHLRDYTIAITNFLRALDMLPGKPPIQERYTIITDGAFIHNREGGLFIQDCRVGDFVAKGQLIAHIINLHGETVEEIRSPHDNAYIAALQLPYYPTHAGEIAAEAIPVESYEA